MADGQRDEEAAWFLARERGQPDASIPEARAARYARLEALIADLPATPVSPREGWQQRMRAALEAAQSGPVTSSSPTGAMTTKQRPAGRRHWRAPVLIAALAAVVILVIVVRNRPGPPPAGPAIAFAVERAGSDRGARPRIGDKLVVRAVVNQRGELRVYDDAGVEQARCSAPGSGCDLERSADRSTLVLTMTVQTDRLLRAFMFSPPLGTPSAGLAADATAAERAGIAVSHLELGEAD